MDSHDELIPSLGQFFRLEERRTWPERALLMVDDVAGTVRVVQPLPCDCRTAAGAGRFPAADDDCNDPDKADATVADYDELAAAPEAIDALSPADLNNLACYLLWQADASPESAKQAYDLLKRARQRADEATRPIIDENLERFEAIEPGTPRTLAAFQAMVRSVGRALEDVEAWMVERINLGAE